MQRSELSQLCRRLIKRPGWTAVALVTLALGIGSTVAIFTVVYGVLIRPLPYDQPERLVGLWHTAPALGITDINQSYGTYTLYRERGASFDEVGLFDTGSFNLTGDGEPERLFATRATASLFTVLGVEPLLGRRFDETDERGDDIRRVLVGYGFWQRRLGGRPDALGSTLQLDGEAWEVIGVMPRSFAFPNEEVDLWVPHPIDPEELAEVNFSYNAVARLAPGVSVERATSELDALLRVLPEAYPGDMSPEMLEQSGMRAYAIPLRDDLVGDIAQVLWVLLATVGFVLLIACANVANLVLVRAESRHRELAVRSAMGASRGRLARHMMLENVVLGLAGGACGVGLAWLAIRFLRATDPVDLPRLAEIRLDLPVLVFAAVVSMVAGLACGALPMLRLRARRMTEALVEGGRAGMTGGSSVRMRSVLVVAQIALALVLLVGSTLMLRTFAALRGVDPGFDRERVLTLRVNLPGDTYDTDAARADFFERLADAAEAVPGAARAGAVLNLPLTDGATSPAYLIEDFPPQPTDPPTVARQNIVTHGYFEALGIPILAGRGIERRDLEQRTGAVVVSAAFARRFWGDTVPVGKRMRRGFPGESESAPWNTIVGVAGDVRDDSLDGDPVEIAYFPPLPQEGDETGFTPGSMSLAVRAEEGVYPTALAPGLRDAVRQLDAALPIIRMRTTGEIARGAMARTTFAMVLLAIAATVALVLGSIGIYGVLSHAVAQRTREIGVRLALGAAPRQVRSMLVGQGLRMTVVGVAVGLAGAIAMARLLATLLFGVEARDPATYAGVALSLLAVASLASLLPARRAARIAPTEALRHE